MDFKREWIKSVEVGLRCPEAEIQRIIGLLKTDYPKVIFKRARFHKTEYALEYEQIKLSDSPNSVISLAGLKFGNC